MTVVVSDTSIITALLTVKHASILQELFDFVLIPAAVERELHKAHTHLPDFIHVTAVAPLIERLEHEAGFRVGERVKNLILKSAGEE